MCLHDYLAERGVKSLIYHCTLDGWDNEISNIIADYLEDDTAQLAYYASQYCFIIV